MGVHWGDKGEQRTVIEPFDLIAVPPGVTRQFINIADADARLMVIIQGQPGEFDDVGRVPETAELIERRFGPETLARIKALGWQFTLDANAPAETPR